MSKAERFIKGCTRNCSNELCAVEDRFEKKVISYHEWLTPDQARNAVEIAREEVIEDLSDKAKVSSGLDGFYYGQGYKQAEKDLELTWEDMMTIDDLLDELLPPKRSSDELVLKGYYEEVLKRFKERSRTWHH
jgi:hypothetical protein